MRWKITGQVLWLMLIVLPLVYISLLVFSILFFGRWRDLSGPEGLYARASQMTLQFEPYLEWSDGQFSVDENKLEELQNQRIWLQVLDENGSEVYQQYKPASAPEHYTPADLILNYRYSGAIKDDVRGYTLFVGSADRGDRQFSYILGFPDTDVVKVIMFVNPQTIYQDIILVAGGAVIVVSLAVLVVAYFYGSHLASPLAEIISGIQRLAQSDYSKRYTESGLYASVYHSLNQLANTLQDNTVERQRLEAAREEWIANISHDVKTPLSSLNGYAELLADPDYHFDEEEVRRYASIIKDKSFYMESLIEDLRLTYQLKNAALPLQKQEANLVAILRDAVIDLLNDPCYSEAPVNFEPAVEKITFTGDRRLLQRSLTNLILNALVHNPAGTPVDVSISVNEDICIAIQDQGQGIPQEEVERLFDRYYRGTNTGQAHKGSGLGMAISKQIIQAHGGSLNVSSQPGKGTRIEIHFPLV